jgi:hypothetical protein
MSNKGKTFTAADLPRITQQRLGKTGQVSPEEKKQLEAWLAAQTERNRIVAYDGEVPLIAEELEERALRVHANQHDGSGIDSQVLSLLRMVMALTAEQRAAVLGAFDKKGALKIPFDKA